MLIRSFAALWVVLAGSAAAGAVHVQPGSLDVDARLSAIEQANADVARISVIGSSRQGRRIPLLEIAGEGDAPPDGRPGVLLVAGTQGDRQVDVLTALGVAERMAASAGEHLGDATLYVVPCLNRDGLAYHRNLGEGIDFGRAPAGGDADRDGRAVEDPAEDLNGDGLVTLMRVFDQGPGSEIELTHREDDDDPRLSVTPEADEGEIARFALRIEGVDNDGDGAFNEDGPGGTAGGGIDLDLNFPAHWPEYRDGAGTHPLSDPQTLALAQWLLKHPNVVAVMTYGPHDTLVNVPATGKYDEVGRVPLGIEKDDEPHHKAIAEVFKEITRMTGAPATDTAGSLPAWTYSHLGLFTFSTPVWVRPDLLKEEGEKPAEDAADDGDRQPATEPEEKAPERVTLGSVTIELTAEGVQAAMAEMEGMTEAEREEMFTAFRALDPAVRDRMQALMQGGGEAGAGDGGDTGDDEDAAPGKPGGSGTDDGKWLTYSDEQRDGEGFVDWQPFDHPQLGRVEIGGFVPGFRVNPPDEAYPRLIDEQTRFLHELVGRLPRLGAARTEVERQGPGVWRVSVRLTNSGALPTRSAIGVKTRRLPPEVVVLELPDEAILSGEKVQRIDAIPGSGGFADVSWLVAAEDGSSVTIEIRSPVFGRRGVELPLIEEGR